MVSGNPGQVRNDSFLASSEVRLRSGLYKAEFFLLLRVLEKTVKKNIVFSIRHVLGMSEGRLVELVPGLMRSTGSSI